MDKQPKLADLNTNNEPEGQPKGTSSKLEVPPKEAVHGKDALKKIRDFNPALFEIISKAYDPKK